MKRRSNFTLVEIIAVLLVIAIMAAVAAPKFVSIADEARKGVAQAGINEAKATLSVAYSKAYIKTYQDSDTTNDGTVTGAMVLTESGLGASSTFGDVVVSVVVDTTDTDQINLTSVSVGGVAVTTASDTWSVP